jgi:N-acetylneuraminic acid mutarotase
MKAKVGLLKSCALVVLFVTGVVCARADYWEARAPGLGARVAHTAVLADNGEIIVWGGGRANRWLNDGMRYNIGSDSWAPISANHGLAGRWWHVAVWTGKEMIVWGGRGTFFWEQHYGDGALYNPRTDTWRPMSSVGAPSPRSQFTAVWTGTEMIVWGGTSDNWGEHADGARYNPETDTWTPLPPAPLDARTQHTAVWTGTEMIIFGGFTVGGDGSAQYWSTFGDGARYDPASNTWTPLNSRDAPRSRTAHSAVWTGREMIVWGGRYLPDYVFLNSGASYDPVQDRWTSVNLSGAPQTRMEHAAVWSGTEMIIWGGMTDPSGGETATGGRYNPATATWVATTQEGAAAPRFFGGTVYALWTGTAMFIYGGWDYPVELNTTALYYPVGGPVVPPQDDFWERRADGPGGRVGHTTVLTGDEIIVWGGGRANSFLNDGAIHDLHNNTWRPISQNGAPSGRWCHAAVWTGEEMLIWGGRANFFAFTHRMDGGRYNPRTDRWRTMSTVNAPAPRSQLAYVWTGRELIVWGGMTEGASELADGGRYDPQTDTWQRIGTAPVPGRFDMSAIWTGTEMISWGGMKVDNYLRYGSEVWTSFADGIRYHPQTGTWRLVNSHGAPGSRTAHTTVWTGSEMIVWGGRLLPEYTFWRNGGAYNPHTDSWTPIETLNAPQARAGHAAVWTGQEMIVFGGWIDHAGTEINTGGRYDPVARAWAATTLVNAPHRRFWGTPDGGLWTGDAMFIYGGWDYPNELNSAYLYHPPSGQRMLEELIRIVDGLDLPSKTERPLEASLNAALRSLEAGNQQAAASQLKAFQSKVETQLGGQDPELAARLIEGAQAILDQLGGE